MKKVTLLIIAMTRGPALSMLLCTVLSVGLNLNAQAGVSVIVHPANANSLAEIDIKRIFLGKKQSFPDGSPAIPINQDEASEDHAHFAYELLKKTPRQLKSYWARLIFTGQGTAPQEVKDAAEVKALISTNPNLIGFINSSTVDSSIKVIFEF